MKRVLTVIGAMVLFGVGLGQSTESTIQAKCAADWPGDFDMQAYCQRNQRAAVAALQQLRASHGGIAADAFKTARAGCIRDWPDDYAMQAYCLRNQIEGYNTVNRGPTTPLTELTAAESATIDRHCRAEWPRDFAMQAYCGRQQADGAAYLRGRTNSRAVQACARDWPEDFAMQAYCVREGLY